MRHLRVIEEIACVGALVLTCVALLSDLGTVRDLPSWDEADYLRRGLDAGQRLPDAEWGPLYALWYFALSFVIPDRIALYETSYRLLVLGPALLLYVCARRLNAPPAIALACGVTFVLSDAAHIHPRPGLWALSVVLAALLAAMAARRPETRWALLALGLLTASFARPELFVGFLFVAAVLAGCLVARLRRRELEGTRSAWPAGACALAAAALLAFLGNPLSDGTGRRLDAFCQHFALGEVMRSEWTLDPWHQCREVLRRSFGDVTTVPMALAANPSAFAVHVTDNLRRYPRATLHMFLPILPAEADVRPQTPRDAGTGAAFAVLCVWCVLCFVRGRRACLRRLGAPGVRVALVATCAALGPTLLSSLLLYPRVHYLVLQTALLPLVAVAVASGARARVRALLPAPGRRALGLGAAMVAVYVAPGLTRAAGEGVSSLPNRRVVEALRALRREPPLRSLEEVRLLELQGGYDVWAGEGFQRAYVTQRREGESFEAFLRRMQVQVVVIEPVLARDARLRAAAGFESFLASPSSWGFVTHSVAGTDRIIAVRLQCAEPDRCGPLTQMSEGATLACR